MTTALVLALVLAEAPAAASAEVARGAEVYAARCSQCHGETGAGDGPGALFMLPRPRVFKENARYKLRSTPTGELPLPQDLFDVVTRGIPGTAMPAFVTLPEKDRWALVAFIRSLAEEFSDPAFLKSSVAMPELTAKAPPETPASLERGKQLFDSAGCIKCHGLLGRGNGPSWHEQKDEAGDHMPPRNFSNFDRFRRGSERADIFATITTGLDGTPMSSFAEAVPFEDRWALADYVHSLRPRLDPAQTDRVFARRLEALPASADDAAWAAVGVARVALAPNLVEPPRLYWPAVEFLYVQAAYTRQTLALRVQWDDRTQAKAADLATAYTDRDGAIYLKTEHPDELAVQFPARAADHAQRPYFLFGDGRRPVNLWWWKSNVEGLAEYNAKGFGAVASQPAAGQALTGAVSYDDGRYTLVVTRALRTDDARNDAQFEPGASVPLAFHVWEGGSGELGLRGGFTTWTWLMLEPEASSVAVVAPLGGFTLTLGLLLAVVRRVRRSDSASPKVASR